MFLGIALLIAASFVIFVITPLLSPEKAGEATLPVDVTPLADLKRRRLVLYENIQDLEFEYKAGKIARDDYQSLSAAYRAEAASLMATSQEAGTAKAEEEWIEREVEGRRAERSHKRAPEYLCPKCGFENPLPVKFCGECGARLKRPK